MNVHTDKIQEDKSQSVVDPIFQKKSARASTFQFVDNRPEALAQRKIQELANNSPSVKQLKVFQAKTDNYSIQQQQALQKKATYKIPNNDLQPIQRVIKLRNGTIYDKGAKNDKANVKKMKNSNGIFLFENQAALDKTNKGNNKGVKILSPNKHIIGEHHQQSRFQQAVNDWGWGAQQMRESLSENALMPSIASDQARQDANREEYQALPQEDTMVKNLASLLAARGPVHGLSLVAGIGAAAYNANAIAVLQVAAGDINSVLNCTNDLIGYYEASPSFWSRIWNWTYARPLVNRIGRAISRSEVLGDMYQMIERQQQNNPHYVMTQAPLTLGLTQIDELIAIYKELINITQNDLYTRHNLAGANSLDGSKLDEITCQASKEFLKLYYLMIMQTLNMQQVLLKCTNDLIVKFD